MANKDRSVLKNFSSEELSAEIVSRAKEKRALEFENKKKDREACREVFTSLCNLIIDSGITDIHADAIPLMKNDLPGALRFETSDDAKPYRFAVGIDGEFVWFSAFYGGLDITSTDQVLSFSYSMYVDSVTVTHLAVEKFLAEFRIYCDNVLKAQTVFSGFSDKLRTTLDGPSNG